MTPVQHHEILLQGFSPVFASTDRGLQAGANPGHVQVGVIRQGAVESGVEGMVGIANGQISHFFMRQRALPVAVALEEAAPFLAIDKEAGRVDATGFVQLGIAPLAVTVIRAGIGIGPAV